jgi:protocatechuate 3,4-dioxygenase beta subunit
MKAQHSLGILLAALALTGLAGAGVGEARFEAPQGPPPPRPAQGQPPRDVNAPGAPLAVGKGSISGTVVVAGTGQPARRARVGLSGGADVGGGRSTTTDDMGRFAFGALPEGRYNLSASKPGHISGSYGQRSPGRPGTPIQLADGQKLELQLQITRGGVITGTVLDEHAEAVPGTPVRALRYVMQSGQRTLQSAGSGQTDDRGVYRIYGLQPGEYIVYAAPRNTTQGVQAARQAELQQLIEQSAAVARLEAAQAQALQQRIAQLRANVPAPDSPDSNDATSGYAPVYYPGTTAPSSAAPVTLAPGEEKGSIDFQYQVVPIASVEGYVTSTASQPVSNIQVSLVNTAFAVPGISPGSARPDAQGAFRIPNVPPGQYSLIARATIGGPGGREGGPAGRGAMPGGRGEMLAGRGRAGAASGPDLVRLWATADVTVDGRNVSNVVLTLQPGMSVSGRIVFEGAAQQPADLTRLRVNLAPAVTPGAPAEVAIAAAGRVDAEGRFSIASVVPGRYRLNASGAGSGWFLGSSTVDGQESLDFPLEVKPNQAINGAVVTFVDRQSELAGTIVNERAQPVPDYTLIVYPADQRYWTPQSRRIQSARPATDGRFSFRNLPAGEYRLVPVYDPEPGSWFDPAFLQQLETASVRVSIAEGEKKEQHLRVPGGNGRR